MRRAVLLILSLLHARTSVSPFALADATTAAEGECADNQNDRDGSCASDTHREEMELCTIYLHDETANNDDNDNKDIDGKNKYRTIHCSEEEIAYLLEMDEKSTLEREETLVKLEDIVKTAMEAKHADADADSLRSARRYNVLKQLQDIQTSTSIPRRGPDGIRLVTPAELSAKVGKGGADPKTNPIWLAVMGRVYDVTAGEGFYKFGGGGYSLFAGRDASPCFATGNFTVAGAEQPIGDLDGKALAAILEGMEFYEKSEKYEYVGVLAGGIFYDEEGRETEVGRRIREKATAAKEEADRIKEEKKREREKRRADRMKNKKNKKTNKQ